MTQAVEKMWICSMCGYVHYGAEPPEECPVCGADRDLFEPGPEPAASPAALQEWRCPDCGYIHAGAQPQEDCPICGAAAGSFELVEALTAVGEAGKPIRVAIIGGGIAGVSAAEALYKAAPQAEITLISKEAELPYYRLNLTRYLAGEVNAEQLAIYPAAWYADHHIRLMLKVEVVKIDLDQKELALSDDSRLPFDKLIITAGAYPFVPPFPGTGLKQVTTLRTRQDADFLLQMAPNQRGVCIGGGILGLEAAGALARRGVKVTVLEDQAWLMPRQLNQAAGKLFQEKVLAADIALRTQAKTRQILGENTVSGVLLEDGTTLPADLVVISTGVRSNIALARQAGLAVNRGIIVEDTMQTSHPDVFAAGDVAEHRGNTYGIWGPAQAQGTVAGSNAAGMNTAFVPLPRSNKLKVLGYDVFSIGKIALQDSSEQMIDAQFDGKYAGFVFRDQVMVGAILLGDTSLSSKVKQVIEDRLDCSAVLAKKPEVQDILQFLGRL